MKRMPDAWLNFRDSRAMSPRFMQAAQANAAWQGFMAHVRGDDALELCLRGNAKPQKATVYYKGNKFCDLWLNSRHTLCVGISTTHARNMADPAAFMTRYAALGFSTGADNRQGICRYATKTGVKPSEVDAIIALTAEMLENFFENNIPEEKIEQQKLFSALTNVRDGHFAYDMEFHQAFPNREVKNALKKELEDNKPDLLAVRFAQGRPAALVLIEVKSRVGAMTGKSGALAHMIGMKRYAEFKPEGADLPFFIRNRCHEVHDVLDQYRTLGLRGLGQVTLPGREAFEALAHQPVDRILLLTGGVRDFCRTNPDQWKEICDKAPTYGCQICELRNGAMMPFHLQD